MLQWVEENCVLLELPGGGLGSAGLVGPGLILTALHNVFDPGDCHGDVPFDAVMPVARALADLMAAFEASDTARNFNLAQVDLGRAVSHPLGKKLRTELVWPIPGTPFGPFDVAVLQVVDPVLPDSAMVLDPARFDIEAIEHREVSLWGCGFPRINIQHAGPAQIEYRQHRILTGVTARETSALTHASLLKVSNPNPRSASDWQGVSGCLLWVDAPDQRPRLAGVINESITHALDNDELYFTDIQKLGQDTDFLRALDRSSLAPVEIKAERSLSDVISTYKCELDRDMPRGDLLDWIDDTLTPEHLTETAPTAFVIPVVGHTFDEPSLFIRTCLHLFDVETPLPFDQQAETFSQTIAESDADIAVRRKGMYRSVGRRYSSPGRRGTPGPGELAMAMADPTHPRVLVVEHTDPQLSDICVELIGELLSIVAMIERPDETAVPYVPMIVFVCFVTGNDGTDPDNPATKPVDFAGKGDQADAALDMLKTQFPTLTWPPETLALNVERCRKSDITNWLDMLRSDDHDISTAFEDALRLMVERHSTFPIRFADFAINETLKEVN